MNPLTIAAGASIIAGLLSKKPKAPSAFLTPYEKGVYEAIYKDIYDRLYTVDPKTGKDVLKPNALETLTEYLYGPALRSAAMAMEDHKRALANTLAAMGASGATGQALAQLERQFLQDLFSFTTQARRAPLEIAQAILGGSPVAIQATGSPGRDLSDLGVLVALLADAFKPKTATPMTGYTPGILSLGLSLKEPASSLLFNPFLFHYSNR